MTTEVQISDSARLSFRLLDQHDGALLFELDQDEAVMKYINGGRRSSMADINDRMLPRMMAYRNPAKGWGLWQVCQKATAQTPTATYLGWVLVRPMGFFSTTPKLDNLELGWRFKQACWGQGFASEAALAVLTELAKQPGIRSFSAIAVPDNQASIAVMKKLGMQFVRQGLHADPTGDIEAVFYQRLLPDSSIT